ncbi:hypothetical protein L9F63_018659, partial [Diploptera punctata]
VNLENIEDLIFGDNSDVSDLSELSDDDDDVVETSLVHVPYTNREPEEVEASTEEENPECEEDSNEITEYEGIWKRNHIFEPLPPAPLPDHVPDTEMIDPISRFFRYVGNRHITEEGRKRCP